METGNQCRRVEVRGKRTGAACLALLILCLASALLSACSDATYDISGRVTAGGAALPGVSVTVTGGETVTTTTDGNGNFVISNVDEGTLTVTPSLKGYVFTPPSRTAWVRGMSASGFDFWAILPGRLAAATHTVQIKGDGSVWAWGENGSGQTGNGTTADTFSPLQIAGFTAAAVASGTNHTVALRSDGTVWTWGDNASGQLGDGTTTVRLVPGQVAGLTGVKAIAAGHQFSAALKNDGSIWTWGNNAHGQLGDGTTNDRLLPVQVANTLLSVATSIAAGYDHMIALRGDASLWCWGNNAGGQLGDGTTSKSPVPLQLTALGYAAAIAAGYQYSLALYYTTTNYTIYAWGINNSGQLGNGTTTASATPVPVSGITSPVAIAAGHDHAVALSGDGTVYAWGNNANGQLGNGTTTNSSVAIPVEGLTGGINIAAGTRNCFALKTDGTLWAWGRNDRGQLGDGTAADRLKPVRIP